MKYFKNTELAKLYNVSEKSVRNWIQAAQENKLELQLYKLNSKFFVANTSRNTTLIELLVEKGKKYKNTRGHKSISPTAKFYETYTDKQILDIISNLNIRHEIPLQYSYVDGGADYWDKYAHKLYNENTGNILNRTIELLDGAYKDIGRFTEGKRINIIDLGPGNGLPVKDFLTRLIKDNRLNRYVAIDTSKEMLAIIERNIHDWFEGKVEYKGYLRDISRERFDDILAADYTEKDGSDVVNVVMLLGGTTSNFRSPDYSVRVINDSLGLEDILIYNKKLDTPNTRRYFDFSITMSDHKLTPRHRLILDLLNIDEALYEVEQHFDPEKAARYIKIRPNIDLTLNLQIANQSKIIELRKHSPITIWRAWHWSLIEIIRQFTDNDFDVLQMNRTKETEYCLLMLKITPPDSTL